MTRSQLRVRAITIGLFVAAVGSASDYWVVKAISVSTRYGAFVYKLRFVGFPGILGSAIVTGLASGNFHGPRSDVPYYAIAFVMNAMIEAERVVVLVLLIALVWTARSIAMMSLTSGRS